MRRQHKHVSQIGDDAVIGDDAGESDLAVIVVEQPEVQRVRDGPLDDLAGNAPCPVGVVVQERMDAIDVEAFGIGRDQVLVAAPRTPVLSLGHGPQARGWRLGTGPVVGVTWSGRCPHVGGRQMGGDHE